MVDAGNASASQRVGVGDPLKAKKNTLRQFVKLTKQTHRFCVTPLKAMSNDGIQSSCTGRATVVGSQRKRLRAVLHVPDLFLEFGPWLGSGPLRPELQCGAFSAAGHLNHARIRANLHKSCTKGRWYSPRPPPHPWLIRRARLHRGLSGESQGETPVREDWRDAMDFWAQHPAVPGSLSK